MEKKNYKNTEAAVAVTEEKSSLWKTLAQKHPNVTQFVVFFLISNGVTVLQMVLMPLLKLIFGYTDLVNTSFQVLAAGKNLDGSIYYVFDYARGALTSGGGGGLAYFLAVEITLLIAQVINFILQRKVTFRSNGNIARAAGWYFIAWVAISIGASALQGLYKTPIYTFLIQHLGSQIGVTVADVITMFINCIISFWVFFPILKIIFREKE